MNRSYTAHSPYSLAPTERIPSYSDYSEPPVEDFDYDYPGSPEFEDYDDYEQSYDEESIDRRWMWVAGVAGVILFIAIGTTGIILGGGDSGSVSATATSDAPAPSSAPATTAPNAGTAAPIVPSLPPETVTTVTPSAETTPPPAPSTTAQAAVPPPAPPSPRTVTYRVTGNRQLLDLVTVIYTDGQGALRTDVNVALPWVKQVVLDPGVELKSVTATSVGGQLNCSILDAAGTLIAAQNNNSMIATCTQ
ncbi:hypothetical protein [Mycobacterium sp. 852014-52144_SCH5372336]|uniref:hypothetical protein n=1 Tax=Mycobacterium sp. 852014-52144_SCH5372336 TaxID=1834115 RepID=UPI0007FF64A7|nr:hypothetical protein [Mycobacterium sp. 852014-52144_SCH5372336]OBB74729.1 hypothetical protein A5759_10625 [Mycobacterium sp. 852014-52144_SCH5372336]